MNGYVVVMVDVEQGQLMLEGTFEMTMSYEPGLGRDPVANWDAQLAVLTGLAIEARTRGAELLWDRWAELDRVDPITRFDSRIKCERSSSESRDCLVKSHQITSVDGEYREWGQINNRGYTYKLNMETLGLCESDEDFAEYLYDLEETRLMAHPGPLGPLFDTGSDGRHRTHIIKALALPELLVRSIYFPAVPQQSGDRATIVLDTRLDYPMPPLRSARTLSESKPAASTSLPSQVHQAGRRQGEQDRDVMIAHLTALEGRRFIDGLEVSKGFDHTVASFTLNRDLPAYWALEIPSVVERMSRRYARSYPEFTSTEAGQAMCDRNAWLNYLGINDTEAVMERTTTTKTKRMFERLRRTR